MSARVLARSVLVALGVGLGLGLLPFVLSIALGFAQVVLMPFAYGAAGWFVARSNPQRRWLSIALLSAASGLAYVWGFNLSFAFAEMLGGQPQSLPVSEAVSSAWQTALITLLFASVGCAIAIWTGRKPKAGA